jgi:hypothetical protein
MYKIVKCLNNGKLVSVICSRSDAGYLKRFKRSYKVGKTVSTALCFGTLKAAYIWLGGFGYTSTLRVYKVKYSKRKRIKKIFDYCGRGDFWAVPYGTWECFDVELIGEPIDV